jgi:hypothetical protein
VTARLRVLLADDDQRARTLIEPTARKKAE